MIQGTWRAWRGLAVGLAVVAIAVVGHVAAGGTADIRSTKFLVLALFALPVAWQLSDREWTLPRLLAALAASQVLIHVALQARLFAPANLPTSAGSLPAAMTMHAAGPLSPHLLMFSSHLVAVVVTAILLRKGELAALALRSLLASLFCLSPHLVAANVPELDVVRIPVASAPVLALRILRASLSRRGPPVVAATSC
jgi:hypothetical protein